MSLYGYLTLAALVFAIGLFGVPASGRTATNFGAGLGHVDVKMLSGSPGGNYGAIVERVSKRAAKATS